MTRTMRRKTERKSFFAVITVNCLINVTKEMRDLGESTKMQTELGRDKLYLTAVSLAGEKSVSLPVEHSLILYLKYSGLDFAYQFTWPFFYPIPETEKPEWAKEFTSHLVEYPHSMELAEDLSDLCAANILRMERSSSLAFASGELAHQGREKYLDYCVSTSGISFEKLSSMVKGSIAQPKRLIDESYKLYVDKEIRCCRR